MNVKIIFFLSIFVCNLSYSQISENRNSDLKINSDIVMPKDSLAGEALLFSVNAFLSLAQENTENKWILAAETVETQILIDEIQNIQKSKEFENDTFFKAYVTNIIPLEKDKYAVKISYIGTNENTAILRASFELIAHKMDDDSFLISSPLLRNTENWKSKKIQNYVFHYPYTIDDEKLEEFVDLTVFYDKKLKNNEAESHHYLCKNEINPLELFGVDYKSDYNGNDLNTSWVSQFDKKMLLVLNESDLYGFDPHDLWHNRLSQVISRRKVNRRVDENISYLYGGSWGISWEELFRLFTENYVVGDQADWLDLWTNSVYFEAGGHKNYAHDFTGALIVKKIETEKGFDGVWELLNTKGNEEYFIVLDKLIGITKKNYNIEVYKLIEEEMNNFGI